MKNFYLLCLLFFFFGTFQSFAYLTEGDEFYYEYMEPKLNVLAEGILIRAENIALTRKPSFEMELTAQERYFSRDYMEFFGPEDGHTYEEITSQYSGVIRRVAWFDDMTLITGWVKSDKVFHVNFIYTINPAIAFPGYIAVGLKTDIVEKYFTAPLQNISVENGVIGYPVRDNDDWSAYNLFIRYNNKNIITSISAENNTTDDIVPIIPESLRFNDFVKQKVKELEYISIHNPPQRDSVNEILKQSIDIGGLSSPRILTIIFVSLSIGVFLSIWSIKKFFMTTKPVLKEYDADEVIDAEFVENDDRKH